MSDLPEQQRILRNRARRLAREAAAASSSDALELVEFEVQQERYGIETSAVCEVVSIRDLTPLPCVPPHIAGILNVRGEIVAAIDLARVLGLPRVDAPPPRKALLLKSLDGAVVALAADAILGVRQARSSEWSGSLAGLRGPSVKYFRGITPDNVIVLDSAALVEDEALLVREEVEL